MHRRWMLSIGMALVAALPLIAAELLATTALTKPEEQWPGLWGAERNATAAGPGWELGSGTKAKILWRRPIGSGYSEAVIANGRGYTMETDGTSDRAVAFDLATGKEIWAVRVGPAHKGRDGSDDGPISTPAVDGGQVFVFGPRGVLFAFAAADGQVQWTRDVAAELQASPPHYGFAAAPLIAGKMVILQAGGEAHNLVAFDRATGKTSWSVAHSKKTGYASPILTTLGGVPQVVSMTADRVYGVRAEDGKLLWKHPAPEEPGRSPTVLPGGRMLVSFWGESLMLQVTPQEEAFAVKELWKKPQLRATYSPTVFHAGYLFGMSGDYLVCVDPETGETKWRHKIYGTSLIRVGDHLAVLGRSSGNLHLIDASPQGFHEHLRTRVFNPGARSFTGPSFAGGRLYLRNLEELVAVEITAG